MSEIDELRQEVVALTKRMRALESLVEITQLVAQYGPSVDSGSADATAALWTEADRFWVARVSANTLRWQRTAEGWKIVDRVNANLDGSAQPRDMLAPGSA